MGIFSIFNLRRRAPGTVVIRASYDATKTHDQNRRHWANADHLSADAAGSVAVRKKLRSRSRYEFENNPYARGIAHTMANYVIGQGPRLQVLTDDPARSREIERLFGQWSKAVQLPQKLRTARISQVVSGEVFLQFTQSNRADQNAPTLDVKLIESDQVATPWATPITGYQEVDGVIFDQYGEVEQYIVLDAHPGDSGVFSQSSHNVPANQMIHLFRPDRPGQHRGIPELASALETFAQLRRYMQAVLSAAERAAETSLYFRTNCPPGEGPAQISEEGDSIGSLPAIEVRRNESVFLPEGWEPFQLKAEQPTAEFTATVHQYLAEIGRVLQIPVMIITGDASNHNYASGRLDYQAFVRMIEVERSDYVDFCLDRIFDEWYREASLMGLVPQGPINRQWYWPGIEHIDELKAANAASARIAGGLTSIAVEQARAGYDWEDQQRQQADCLGLTLEDYRRRLADKILGPDTAKPQGEANAETTQPA